MLKLVERNFTSKPRKDETRKSLFEKRDRPVMRALPPSPFQVYDSKRGTVPDYYHIEYDSFYYSIPYTYYHQTYELHAYQHTIEIFIGNEQVAVHVRTYHGKRYVTKESHMPEKDRYYKKLGQKDGSYYKKWASYNGEACQIVIATILNSYDYEPQSYKSCMGILSLAKKFGTQALNSACKKAIEFNSISYTTVKRLLSQKNPQVQNSLCSNECVPLPSDLRTKEWETLLGGGSV